VMSAASGVAWRILKRAFTNPAFFLPPLMFPLIFFLGFAGGLSRVDQIPGFDYEPGYETFQFAFILLQFAAMSGVFTGFGIAQDFERGFARRLLIAVQRRSAIIVGYWLATVVRWLFNMCIVFVIALIVGMEVHGDGLDVFALILLAMIVNVVGTLWAAGVALRLRSMQAGPVMQLPIFLLIFLAPVFVPLELLRGWVHAVATVNPFTALLEAARSLLAGSTDGVALAFAIVIPLAAMFAVWALRGLRIAERST
jgi:ABC-type multidrug transport system permease subunit